MAMVWWIKGAREAKNAIRLVASERWKRHLGRTVEDLPSYMFWKVSLFSEHNLVL